MEQNQNGYQGGYQNYQNGGQAGYPYGQDGYQNGYQDGYQNGYQNDPYGYQNGYPNGYQADPNGYPNSWQSGYQNDPNGYPNGWQTGYQNGAQAGYPNGYAGDPNGYQSGYPGGAAPGASNAYASGAGQIYGTAAVQQSASSGFARAAGLPTAPAAKRRTLAPLLFVCLLIFTALCFTRCVDATQSVTHMNTAVIGEESRRELSSFRTGYAPFLCAAITAIELFLLFRQPGFWKRLFGMLLSGIKLWFPLRYMRFKELLFSDIGSNVSTSYELNNLGRGLQIFGCVILALYLADLILVLAQRKKS